MKNMEKINKLSENPCVCLCQCVLCVVWLPFVIVYNLLKPIFKLLKYVYHLICCVSSKDGAYGGGNVEERNRNFDVKEMSSTINFDRPLQFV